MNQLFKLKHIADLETVLGFRLSQIDFSDITEDTINYSWGDEEEVHEWIRHMDASTQFSGNVYTVSGDDKIPVEKRKKYPLIWLVTPIEGRNTDFKNFDGVNLIICSDTEEQWLNKTRWGKRIPMLQAIADRIIDKLRGNVRIAVEDGNLVYAFRNVPKFSASEKGEGENKTIDLWDAVVLNLDLIIDDSCKSEAYYEFCNNNNN